LPLEPLLHQELVHAGFVGSMGTGQARLERRPARDSCDGDGKN
jgi:hypothetical protein